MNNEKYEQDIEQHFRDGGGVLVTSPSIDGWVDLLMTTRMSRGSYVFDWKRNKYVEAPYNSYVKELSRRADVENAYEKGQDIEVAFLSDVTSDKYSNENTWYMKLNPDGEDEFNWTSFNYRIKNSEVIKTLDDEQITNMIEKARQKEVEHAYKSGFEIEFNYNNKSNCYDNEWVIKTTDGFDWRLHDYRVAEDQSARLERLRREEVEEAHARGEELEWNSVDSETREYLCTSGWDGFALNQFDDRFSFNWVDFDYRVKEKFETPSTEDMVEQSANHHY